MDAFTDSDAIKMGSSMVGAALAPATGGLSALLPIGASIISGIGNLFGTSSANKTQMEIAQKQMDWQTAENQKNRDFQQSMWNLQNEYNSPKNQRKLLEEGNFNPFVQEFNGGNSNAGSVGSPSMVGAPNMPHIQPINPLAMSDVLMQALSVANQKEQVDSNVDVNKANIVKTLAQIALESYDKLGFKGYRALMSKLSPILDSINLQGSRSDSLFNEYLANNLSMRYNQDMDSLNKELQYRLGSQYSVQQIKANLDETSARIKQIFNDIDLSQVRTHADLKKIAAEIVVAGAQAWNLRKVGDYYVANAKTVDALRDGLSRQTTAIASMRENELYHSNIVKESNSYVYGYMTSDQGKRYKANKFVNENEWTGSDLGFAVDQIFGNYIKIGGSANVGFNQSHNTSVSDVHSVSEIYK